MPQDAHHRRKLALGLFFLLASPINLYPQGKQQPVAPHPAIRVSTNLVYIWVSVTDSRGRFIPGLHRGDFEVFDDGVLQPAVDFASDEEPAHVVFLIEKGTADVLLKILNRSPLADAGVLAGEIPSQDYVAIVTYSDHTDLVSDFTSDKDVTRLALEQTEAGPDNGNHRARVTSGALDLSASLATTTNWLSKTHGSQAIVLFSTGFDATPPGIRENAFRELAASDVRIFAISAFGDLRTPIKRRHLSQDDRDDRAFVKAGLSAGDESLAQLCTLTGGRVYLPKTAADFSRAYAEISQSIRGQYTLGIAPMRLDGRLHQLQVRVKRHRYRVAHRPAYFAEIPK